MPNMTTFRSATRQPIVLDYANAYIPDVRLNAGDVNGRTLSFELTNHGMPVNVDGVRVALLYNSDPDRQLGDKVYFTHETQDGHDVFTGAIPRQALLGSADILLGVQVEEDAAVVCSRNFMGLVERSVFNVKAPEAVDKLGEFAALAAHAKASIEKTTQAVSAAETAATNATATVNREVASLQGKQQQAETAEASRVQAERQRQSAEEARVNAETSRAHAEQARTAAEAKRESTLTAKLEGWQHEEQARATAETARASAEAARALAQQKNNTDQQANNQAAQGLQVTILTSSQYDANTGTPTIQGGTGKIYFVPTGDTGVNKYAEWMWLNSTWEKIGMSSASFEPVSTQQIDEISKGKSMAGQQVLNLNGLSYLVQALKTVDDKRYAPMNHGHTAAGITAGVLPIERGGTGSGNAAYARNNLGITSAINSVKNELSTSISANTQAVAAAKTAADAAKSTADDAKAQADTAYNGSELAQHTAIAAKTTADAAKARADEAYTKASQIPTGSNENGGSSNHVDIELYSVKSSEIQLPFIEDPIPIYRVGGLVFINAFVTFNTIRERNLIQQYFNNLFNDSVISDWLPAQRGNYISISDMDVTIALDTAGYGELDGAAPSSFGGKHMLTGMWPISTRVLEQEYSDAISPTSSHTGRPSVERPLPPGTVGLDPVRPSVSDM